MIVTGALTFAHADDATEQVRQSYKALIDAPAYRMTGTYTDLHNNNSGIVTLEYVGPDAMEVRWEQQGHIVSETIAIGKNIYVRQGMDGKFKETPGDAAAIVSRMRSTSLESFKGISNVVFVGHVPVNGEPSSVYKYKAELEGAHSNAKVWISNKTHLPLRSDSSVSYPPVKRNGEIIQQHVIVTITYGSSLKLTPPPT